ncbi:hypothetical protein V8C34DRAFT_156309 [Trichoderma compactum]
MGTSLMYRVWIWIYMLAQLRWIRAQDYCQMRSTGCGNDRNYCCLEAACPPRYANNQDIVGWGRAIFATPEGWGGTPEFISPLSAALDRDKGHNFSRSPHAGQCHRPECPSRPAHLDGPR